ncbi:MAG TPA: coenzyme F420-0:L-glutamate ligase [Terriglobales bacterium]|jgi:coenzyme F420-0:L-glutamate ligase/coenzyme F420-1:gamma-L-glutamate ligase
MFSQELKGIPVRVSGEIRPGDSLAEKILLALRSQNTPLRAGDILVVKHKIVSKAEGQLVELNTIQPSRSSQKWAAQYGLDARVTELSLRQSRRVVRRKRGVLITETRHGLICANSGVDVSNVDGGKHALLLPEDPDRSAEQLYREIKKRLKLTIPIIISDSFGRPWREGLTEVAIGVAGMKPLYDYRRKRDSRGYVLHSSIEAVADELACAAGLVCGKLEGSPACIIRGFQYQPGRGKASELIRPAKNDLFR